MTWLIYNIYLMMPGCVYLLQKRRSVPLLSIQVLIGE